MLPHSPIPRALWKTLQLLYWNILFILLSAKGVLNTNIHMLIALRFLYAIADVR
jgi:hypothetical protein